MRSHENGRMRVLVLLALIALAVPLLSATLAGADEVNCVQVFLNPADPVHVDGVNSAAGCEAGSLAGVRVCGPSGATPPADGVRINGIDAVASPVPAITSIAPLGGNTVQAAAAGGTVWVNGSGNAGIQRGSISAGSGGTHVGAADDDTGTCA